MTNRVLWAACLILVPASWAQQIVPDPIRGFGYKGGTNSITTSIDFSFDGGGFALSGTATRCKVIPAAATITKWYITADQAGSITIGVTKVALGSYTGPGSASSITGAADPALSSAVVNSSASLGAWTTAIGADSVICAAMSAPTTVTWAILTLKVTIP